MRSSFAQKQYPPRLCIGDSSSCSRDSIDAQFTARSFESGIYPYSQSQRTFYLPYHYGTRIEECVKSGCNSYFGLVCFLTGGWSFCGIYFWVERFGEGNFGWIEI